MNRTAIFRVIIFIFLITPITLFADNNAAKCVIERIIGSRANEITFESIPQKDGKDGYAISCSNGKLTLKGSSPTAITYAFSQYLREACNSMVTWSGSNINIPAKFPDYNSTVSYSPYSLRYFLNVCTFGYTAPYWDWNRWEKEIDLMALHGVNMPLASVASEAIAERVWLKMGLTKDETRQFFTGGAYLPWHRMGNLNTWDGPLSDSWMNDQLVLQHKIINRMRELGMNPVANAFAGFVPEAFTVKHPEIKCKHLKWGGFDASMNAYVLPPDSPYFEEIGKLFIQEWEKEFGKNTYYLSDSFNEMELPIDPNDLEGKYRLLSHYGESIYKSIAAGNPDAVWVTQGWTFGYQHKFWDRKSLSSLLEKVPNDKMLIVDLGNDYPKWVWHTNQTWKNHDGFYGKQWIFSYVPNFGGKTLLTGDLNMYATSSAEALAAPNKGNLVGFGSAPEGLENNEVVYELLGDMGWTSDSINLDGWLEKYCISRYGSYPELMKQAWSGLCKSVYSSLYSYPRYTWQTVVPDNRRKSKTDLNDTYMQAIEKFLACAPQMEKSQLYRNDALQFAAQYIGAKADILYKQALHLDSIGNDKEVDKLLNQSVNLLLQADKLLASHTNDKLSNWVTLARNQGTTQQEKDKYEEDAKRLITTWGGFQEDYAARYWNGLIKSYYIPRMLIYFSKNRENLNAWEEHWIKTPGNYESAPYSNPIAEAIKIISKIKHI